MTPEEMEALITANGRRPRQRTTLYADAPADRKAASFGAPPCIEPINPPVREAGLKAPPRLVRPGFAVAQPG
jgi:FO synthase